jgi:cytochrome P450
MIDLWLWLKPRGLDALLAVIMPPEAKRYFKFVEDSVSKREEVEREVQKQGPENGQGRKDMFHYIFNAKDPDTGVAQVLSHDNLMGEANLLVLAGSDTTAVVLAGFFFYSTRNPRVLEKLNREIRTSFSSVDEIRWTQRLSSLPYLRACINETLRMCPGAPTDLDREILSDMNIDSWPVPRGAHVSCSSWCIPQNENSFNDPTVFRPERFIIDEQAGVTSDDVDRANESHFPFSTGPFSCVGKNLAIMELSVTIARTLYRLDFRLVPGDRLGEGSPGLGWGRRNRRMFQLKDAFIALKTGPMVQFRERQV